MFVARAVAILGVVLFCVLSASVAAAEHGVPLEVQDRPIFQRDSIIIAGQDGSQQNLWVEIARTPRELAYGLMKLKALPDTDGMLFLTAQPQEQKFWMKNTFMPLDILFIDGKGTISHIVPNATPLALTYLHSRGKAKAVLEIAGGMAALWRIRVGDRVIYKDIQP